jgi:hypothetical protein
MILIRILVGPNTTNTLVNQNVLGSSNLVSELFSISMMNSPSEIRALSLLTLADLIRSNEDNQLKFSNCQALVSQRPEHSGIPSQKSPPPVNTSAIKAMIQCSLEKEPFIVRAAACCVLQCYLYNNHDGQLAIASTIIPPPGPNPNTPNQCIIIHNCSCAFFTGINVSSCNVGSRFVPS